MYSLGMWMDVDGHHVFDDSASAVVGRVGVEDRSEREETLTQVSEEECFYERGEMRHGGAQGYLWAVPSGHWSSLEHRPFDRSWDRMSSTSP